MPSKQAMAAITCTWRKAAHGQKYMHGPHLRSRVKRVFQILCRVNCFRRNRGFVTYWARNPGLTALKPRFRYTSWFQTRVYVYRTCFARNPGFVPYSGPKPGFQGFVTVVSLDILSSSLGYASSFHIFICDQPSLQLEGQARGWVNWSRPGPQQWILPNSILLQIPPYSFLFFQIPPISIFL